MYMNSFFQMHLYFDEKLVHVYIYQCLNVCSHLYVYSIYVHMTQFAGLIKAITRTGMNQSV